MLLQNEVVGKKIPCENLVMSISSDFLTGIIHHMGPRQSEFVYGGMNPTFPPFINVFIL